MTTRTSVVALAPSWAAPEGVKLWTNRAEASTSRAAPTGMSRFETKRARSMATKASLEGLGLAHSKVCAEP